MKNLRLKAARAAKRRDKKPEFVGDDLSAEKAIKKTKAKNRAFAAILFVITLGFFAFVILNHFAAELKITSLALAPGEPDIIAGWMNFNTSNLIAMDTTSGFPRLFCSYLRWRAQLFVQPFPHSKRLTFL